VIGISPFLAIVLFTTNRKEFSMNQETLELINRIRSREFSTRCEAAKALGMHPSSITHIGKMVIEEGVMDRRQWDACFFGTTPGQGKRGKDRRPRRKPLGKASSLSSDGQGKPQTVPQKTVPQTHAAALF
jgi:hypothetical protein